MRHFKLDWQHGITCCWTQGKRASYSVETTREGKIVCYAAFVQGRYKGTYMVRGEAMRRCEAYDALPWYKRFLDPFKE